MSTGAAIPPEEALQARIGHRFRSPDLLREALTHSSMLDAEARSKTLERLEFLGDRVLGLVAADRLFARFADVGESGLALRLNALVNRTACARAARRAGIGPALRLSKAEAEGGGRDKDTILADACEAVLAALYREGGLALAGAFFDRFWEGEIEALEHAPSDPKTALQEWAARARRGLPAYTLVERSGPDHAPRFKVQVKVEGLAPAQGEGGSKRDAERVAAAALLKEAGLG